MITAFQVLAGDEAIELEYVGLKTAGVLGMYKLHPPARDFQVSPSGRPRLEDEGLRRQAPLEVLVGVVLYDTVLFVKSQQLLRGPQACGLAVGEFSDIVAGQDIKQAKLLQGTEYGPEVPVANPIAGEGAP